MSTRKLRLRRKEKGELYSRDWGEKEERLKRRGTTIGGAHQLRSARRQSGDDGGETVPEGVGVAGLPAWATRGGHDRYPFGTWVEDLRVRRRPFLCIYSHHTQDWARFGKIGTP